MILFKIELHKVNMIMKIPFLIYFFLIIFFLTFNSGYSNTLNIAMSELVGQGVEQATATLVSERLAAWLSSSKLFNVITPSRLLVLCNQNGFNKQCNENDSLCLSEMGKLINADVVISGIFAKSGNFFTIVIRVIDVKAKTILTTGYQDINTPLENILSDWIPKAAKQIENVISTKLSFFGSLAIKTIPQGATVLLNEKDTGISDCVFSRCKPGTNYILISKKTYIPIIDSVKIEPKKNISLIYNLKHTKHFSDSIFYNKFIKIFIRTGLGCLSVASAGAGYYYNKKAEIAIKDEKTAKDAYINSGENSDFNSIWNNYQNAQKETDKFILYRNLLYTSSCLFVVGFTVSFLF